MEKTELRSMIIGDIAKVCKLDAEDIEGSELLMDGLGADSLDVVELTMDIEKRFDISISDAEAELFRDWTVDQLVEYIWTIVKDK